MTDIVQKTVGSNALYVIDESNNTLVVDQTNGRVGINNTNPGYNLTVTGATHTTANLSAGTDQLPVRAARGRRGALDDCVDAGEVHHRLADRPASGLTRARYSPGHARDSRPGPRSPAPVRGRAGVLGLRRDRPGGLALRVAPDLRTIV